MSENEQALYIECAKRFIKTVDRASEETFEKSKINWASALAKRDALVTPDYNELLRIARELQKESGPGFWGRFNIIEHLVSWIWHRGTCVYCGDDLVSGGHIRHGRATSDHLLPKAPIRNLIGIG